MSVQYMLRDVTEDDLLLLYNWRNAEHVRPYMFHSDVIGFDEHKIWFMRLQKEDSMKGWIFEINSKPTGFIYLKWEDTIKPLSGVWGFYIGQVDRPKGVGTIMGYLALEKAFEELPFRQVSAEVISMNQASIRMHEKLGFRHAGILERYLPDRNSNVAIVQFELRKEDWLKQKERIRENVFHRDG